MGGCEGCRDQLPGVGRFRAEEEWRLQDWWLLELEAQEEASSRSSQGNQPLHQGAMRVQGQASFQDCARLAHEEVQGDDQLSGWRFHFSFSRMMIQWAVALDLMHFMLTAHSIHMVQSK